MTWLIIGAVVVIVLATHRGHRGYRRRRRSGLTISESLPGPFGSRIRISKRF